MAEKMISVRKVKAKIGECHGRECRFAIQSFRREADSDRFMRGALAPRGLWLELFVRWPAHLERKANEAKGKVGK